MYIVRVKFSNSLTAAKFLVKESIAVPSLPFNVCVIPYLVYKYQEK